jgi:hypothetical protein
MKRWIIVAGLLATIAGLIILFRTEAFRRVAWQRHVSPGRLSASHRFLEADCAACHTAMKGADDARCVACHANNTALLQRQPTAFHAGIGNCSQCHIEHQGVNARLRTMNHVTLAQIGMTLLNHASTGSESKRVRADLLHWVRSHPVTNSPTASHPRVTPLEMTLNCVSCHATKDRHAGLFGRECAQCHATTTWTIENFQHPSPRSVDCAQCHQAPPSHYMEHFAMISRKMAGQENAEVDQCYRCHQTTSWNDIRGVGWYKHH